jgi:SRSO17 transposase
VQTVILMEVNMGSVAQIEMPAAAARERLVGFVEDVAGCLCHVRQRENALVYVRGLIEHGGRKSLQPTLFRMGAPSARYESVQQFLADSPWQATSLVQAVAERVVPHIDVQALVIDDTGFPKDGAGSPGVKRQYSGTLGKIGNCQIGVSLHAIGYAGTQPVGWALYLPEEWCADSVRRTKTKIPPHITFATKPEIAAGLCEQVGAWEIPTVPVLADQAYGDATSMRTRLDQAGIEYLVAVGPTTGVFGPETVFSVPRRKPGRGRPTTVARPDRAHESAQALAARLAPKDVHTIAFTTGPRGTHRRGRFAFCRVVAAHPVTHDHHEPREEWLVVEWPKGADSPTGYWLSNLPSDTSHQRLAQLARLRWAVELDYRQLKGELGLDHYEGRSYPGWHHHCALVSLAHGFLTLERLCPPARRPI